MTNRYVYEKPPPISGKAGEVVVDGPDGATVLFTPEAAIDTAARLIEAAARAHGDKAIEENRGEQ